MGNMITEDYVSFESARLLRAKGFEGDINAYYHIWDNGKIVCSVQEYSHSEARHLYIPAPTIQITMKWLREVHHIFIDITSRFSKNSDNDVCFSYSCKKLTDKYEIVDGEWLCYEEACESAIKYCLENLI